MIELSLRGHPVHDDRRYRRSPLTCRAGDQKMLSVRGHGETGAEIVDDVRLEQRARDRGEAFVRQIHGNRHDPFVSREIIKLLAVA